MDERTADIPVFYRYSFPADMLPKTMLYEKLVTVSTAADNGLTDRYGDL